jgi:hypothetical protein
MIPPRNFPAGTLKLVELDGNRVSRVHAELTSSMGNRRRIHLLRDDLLISNPRLNLQIVENNAIQFT